MVDLGLISASKEIDLTAKGTSQSDFWEEYFKAIFSDTKSHRNDPTIYNKLKIVEATVNVSEYGKRTKVRTNFQAKILDNRGNTSEVFTVDGEKFYRDFLPKLTKVYFFKNKVYKYLS